jgi:hypothetical protein
MSLLNSQAASLADKVALSAIRESQHRVQAMALIHQKFYQSQGLACIPMPGYVNLPVSFAYITLIFSSWYECRRTSLNYHFTHVLWV